VKFLYEIDTGMRMDALDGHLRLRLGGLGASCLHRELEAALVTPAGGSPRAPADLKTLVLSLSDQPVDDRMTSLNWPQPPISSG
jgi:hypothetical protein